MRAVSRWKNHDLLQTLRRATRLIIVRRNEKTPAHEKRQPHREQVQPNSVYCKHTMTGLLRKYADPVN